MGHTTVAIDVRYPTNRYPSAVERALPVVENAETHGGPDGSSAAGETEELPTAARGGTWMPSGI